MAEKIATTSYAYAIYVRIEAFIRHGIGHFHTHCLLFCFLPLCLRIGVNPLPPPLPFFSPTDVLLQKIVELEWRERFAPECTRIVDRCV